MPIGHIEKEDIEKKSLNNPANDSCKYECIRSVCFE